MIVGTRGKKKLGVNVADRQKLCTEYVGDVERPVTACMYNKTPLLNTPDWRCRQ